LWRRSIAHNSFLIYHYVTCRLTAKNRDQLRNSMLGNRVWAAFTFSFYSAPDRGTQYWACLSVCVFVCQRSYLRNYTSDLHQFFARVTYGSGSVLLMRRSDMLCTSGFIDDVIFAHRPRLLDVAAPLKRSARAALGLMWAVIPVAGQRTHGTTFRALKVTSQVAIAAAESAVYDCLVVTKQSSTYRISPVFCCSLVSQSESTSPCRIRSAPCELLWVYFFAFHSLIIVCKQSHP